MIDKETLAMDEKTFKKTEGVLYNYKDLEVEIKAVELAIKELEIDYKGCRGIGYEERTGETYRINRPIEDEIIYKEKYIEKLELEIEKKKILKEKIENAIRILDDRESEIIKLRYFIKPKKSWVAIGMEVKMDKDYCSLICKEQIIPKLANILWNY
ncbi:siderophore-interacting protein [Clostridium tetani]|uniref:siderophore-interacting protein n=1 Tax=Clostridium tetani TaxID=1513 RepID=UPI001009E094|nr:siderophore-interacting protein [Clostridium tetani]RXI62916.1 siderophore-interacting protein [Clostridium tetani]RXI63437.1 siderophore-interacting protein [Clostridium tetani]RXI66522.1 siderophore-interacting protein [Clostridium tetani]RXI72553.1 siderophore-interacting protein [Clostridium tetani]RXM54029.1 siderophore-interacting protein [Clostridium tetani]